MISTKKVFGSHVLQKVHVNDIAPPHDLVNAVGFAHSCCIPAEWTPLKLHEIFPYNHDTSIFRFTLPKGCKRLNLPVGSFLVIKANSAESDGADAVRPYTSVSDDDILNADKSTETGFFDILVKRYDEWGQKENRMNNFLFTRTDHSYRPPGAASNYIHRLKPGQTLDFMFAPFCAGKFQYPFNGVSTITMIAVGVGIAPMIHTLRSIMKDYDTQQVNDDGRTGKQEITDLDNGQESLPKVRKDNLVCSCLSHFGGICYLLSSFIML
jgi:hypothetical protein